MRIRSSRGTAEPKKTNDQQTQNQCYTNAGTQIELSEIVLRSLLENCIALHIIIILDAGKLNHLRMWLIGEKFKH